MSNTMQRCNALWVVPLALGLVACEEEKKDESAGQPAKTAVSAAPPPPPAPPPAPPPPPEPRDDCPEGSKGPGTFNDPCVAEGVSRTMEVNLKKQTDDGPQFRVKNLSKKTILYGKIVAYFYDKAGKQLEVPAPGDKGKPKPFQTCAGNIFGGVMKPDESAVITFSCVKKEHVPAGTATVEGELEVVGFADDTDKKVEFYWKNPELTPEQRPKGGVKPAKKKK